MAIKLIVTRIGNSRGIRLPARILRRYGIGDSILMEELSEGILLRPVDGQRVPLLSMEETARAMAHAAEDWSEWDALSAEGLPPWQQRPVRVAEVRAPYKPGRRRK